MKIERLSNCCGPRGTLSAVDFQPHSEARDIHRLATSGGTYVQIWGLTRVASKNTHIPIKCICLYTFSDHSPYEVTTVRWSPNGVYVASTDSGGVTHVLKRNAKKCEIIEQLIRNKIMGENSEIPEIATEQKEVKKYIFKYDGTESSKTKSASGIPRISISAKATQLETQDIRKDIFEMIDNDNIEGNMETWETLGPISCPPNMGQLFDISWAPDNRSIVGGGMNGQVAVFDIHTKEIVAKFDALENPSPTSGFSGRGYIKSVAWDPMTLHIAVQSSNREISVWRRSAPLPPGSPMKWTFKKILFNDSFSEISHTDILGGSRISWAPNGKLVAFPNTSASDHNFTTCYEIDHDTLSFSHLLHKSTYDKHKIQYIYDTTEHLITDNPLLLRGHNSRIRNVRFSADIMKPTPQRNSKSSNVEKIFFSAQCSDDNMVSVWRFKLNVSNKSSQKYDVGCICVVQNFLDEQSSIEDLSWGNNGKWLAIASSQGGLVLIDFTNEELASKFHTNWIQGLNLANTPQPSNTMFEYLDYKYNQSSNTQSNTESFSSELDKGSHTKLSQLDYEKNKSHLYTTIQETMSMDPNTNVAMDTDMEFEYLENFCHVIIPLVPVLLDIFVKVIHLLEYLILLSYNMYTSIELENHSLVERANPESFDIQRYQQDLEKYFSSADFYSSTFYNGRFLCNTLTIDDCEQSDKILSQLDLSQTEISQNIPAESVSTPKPNIRNTSKRSKQNANKSVVDDGVITDIWLDMDYGDSNHMLQYYWKDAKDKSDVINEIIGHSNNILLDDPIMPIKGVDSLKKPQDIEIEIISPQNIPSARSDSNILHKNSSRATPKRSTSIASNGNFKKSSYFAAPILKQSICIALPTNKQKIVGMNFPRTYSNSLYSSIVCIEESIDSLKTHWIKYFSSGYITHIDLLDNNMLMVLTQSQNNFPGDTASIEELRNSGSKQEHFSNYTFLKSKTAYNKMGNMFLDTSSFLTIMNYATGETYMNEQRLGYAPISNANIVSWNSTVYVTIVDVNAVIYLHSLKYNSSKLDVNISNMTKWDLREISNLDLDSIFKIEMIDSQINASNILANVDLYKTNTTASDVTDSTEEVFGDLLRSKDAKVSEVMLTYDRETVKDIIHQESPRFLVYLANLHVCILSKDFAPFILTPPDFCSIEDSEDSSLTLSMIYKSYDMKFDIGAELLAYKNGKRGRQGEMTNKGSKQNKFVSSIMNDLISKLSHDSLFLSKFGGLVSHSESDVEVCQDEDEPYEDFEIKELKNKLCGCLLVGSVWEYILYLCKYIARVFSGLNISEICLVTTGLYKSILGSFIQIHNEYRKEIQIFDIKEFQPLASVCLFILRNIIVQMVWKIYCIVSQEYSNRRNIVKYGLSKDEFFEKSDNAKCKLCYTNYCGSFGLECPMVNAELLLKNKCKSDEFVPHFQVSNSKLFKVLYRKYRSY
ncbi:hypothetical protein BEWA_021260 [Theileria equi strain WA]|uniref:Uncharacterized protein n=1 Tax=Theileria equi strain WA TaxID=1537102 RepID=L0AVK7_THEEQ|nr:hypothetical protein BEWA_021260 [Theileria equi strain WA]AFZ79278.1 hypothetical protein BEWA_021260 [Theileria equi strain WA]|eukprot:XP_004828944.1 hypothetical protein BEWA_021260 [Theileria equi strain WA]